MQQYRTIKLKINCSNYDFKRLKECNKESAKVYNLLLQENKNNFTLNNQLYSKNELQSLSKTIETNIICANNKQRISHKIFDAYKAISRARKSGRKDLKYPWKEKRFYPTEWTYQFMFPDYNKNIIKLTTSRYIGIDKKPHNGKLLCLKFKTILPNNIKSLQVIWDDGFYACISYTVNIEERKVISNVVASIDLGEIHAITSIDNNNNQLIITGRKIREIKQFRNKKQAELRSKIDKCKKGSKQRTKYYKVLNYIKTKARKQLNYCIHKITKMYTDWAVEKGISAVYIGDVTGIEKNCNLSSNVNQKLNQWEYGLIMSLLEYKLNNQGIKLIKVNEAYTSQTCPCCRFKNKPKGRNYNCCNCGSKYHRDIVGAWNILHKHYNNELNLPEGYVKYLRIT